MSKVYIILVNWNGWRNTIECLESVFRLNYDLFRVIVCDNASTDDSLDRIAEWASGILAANCANPELRHLTSPPCPKPIPFLSIGADEQVSLAGRSEKLFLVQTGANLGFAGGNNAGLRLALLANDFDYAWLLNNDTVVDPNSLSALVERMRERPDSGMCGSTLLYYDQPLLIQARGGSIYNRWTARGGHIGLGQDVRNAADSTAVESRMKYVVGASMLVSRSWLEQVGLMSEIYFLYFEEIDWATRARGRYSLAYAPQSIVYHKEGGAIGTSADRAKRSATSDYYAARSSMKFTRQHFPAACPTVAAMLAARSLIRLCARNKAGMKAVLNGLWDSL